MVGRATDPSGVESVRFRVNSAAARPATGTTTWRATVRLARGTNRFSILAADLAGNVSAPRRLRVQRVR